MFFPAKNLYPLFSMHILGPLSLKQSNKIPKTDANFPPKNIPPKILPPARNKQFNKLNNK